MSRHFLCLSTLLAVFLAAHVSGWDIVDRRNSSSKAEVENSVDPGVMEKKLNLIFPGTKWCGSGSNAESDNDLGSYEATDKCCRDHDKCPDIIEAGQSRHGLTNSAFYSKLHCDCDLKFKNCLKSNADKPSHAIGVVYFNVLNTQCFKEDFPIIKCAKYFPLTLRCSKYEKDSTAPRRYQFFDVPVY